MKQTELLKSDLKYLLSELVQMPTITAEKATNQAALDWIKYQLRELPLHVYEFQHNGYGTLILTTQPTKHPKVLLSAHIDVIPADDPKEFEFREDDSRYYGRGVFDMKFAVATYMQLLLELGDELKNYDFGVIFTTDEEATGGVDGAGRIVAAGWGADVVIDPDAITPAWAIQKAGKGFWRYRIKSEGQSGHGSRTWIYRNAIAQLMDYLRDLSGRFPSEPCGDPKHVHHTLNIGTIQGGQVANQIAESAHADIDMRVVPGFTQQRVEGMLAEIAQNYPHISYEFLSGSEWVELDMNLECVQRMQAIITQVTGEANEPHLAHGASEANYYAAKGIPVILFECPGGNNHAVGEWIDKKGLDQFAEIITKFVEQEARIG